MEARIILKDHDCSLLQTTYPSINHIPLVTLLTGVYCLHKHS